MTKFTSQVYFSVFSFVFILLSNELLYILRHIKWFLRHIKWKSRKACEALFFANDNQEWEPKNLKLFFTIPISYLVGLVRIKMN